MQNEKSLVGNPINDSEQGTYLQELQAFHMAARHCKDSGFSVVELADAVYKISPSTATIAGEFARKNGKSIDLCCLAIVHGDERAGLKSIRQFVDYLPALMQRMPQVVVVGLGNTEASLANKRYLESDLNRSFGRNTHETLEQKRALVLEPILEQSMLLLDMHQTREPCEEAFFIFPYTIRGLGFAQGLQIPIPVVTHWGDSFSTEGMCTDEYVISKKGIGITAELGQRGFGTYGVSMGYQLLFEAFKFSSDLASGKTKSIESREIPEQVLYTISDKILIEEGEVLNLKPGFRNLQPVKKGDLLGQGHDKKIYSPCDGRILFPFYPTDGSPVPSTLIRILKQVSFNQLGL